VEEASSANVNTNRICRTICSVLLVRTNVGSTVSSGVMGWLL